MATSLRRIVACTSNGGKLAEISRILNQTIDGVDLQIPEIQSLDPVIVSREKAKAAYEILRRPVIVDDTGLSLAALNGFPGALVAFLLGSCGEESLFRLLPLGAEARATAISAIGYSDGTTTEVYVGTLEGQVIDKPRGGFGFGFDTVFVPAGQINTLAEMSPQEKDAISPRGIALRALASALNSH